MKCVVCNIEFESNRSDTKYCSPKCRKAASRLAGVTDNVTLSEPDVTLNFKFTVSYNRKPGQLGYDSDVEAKRKQVRTAKYWYDIPLAAIPIIKKDWPKMPEGMNGRQYFLWWKNEFKFQNDEEKPGFGLPMIHNPFPPKDSIKYEMGGEGSRRWGA